VGEPLKRNARFHSATSESAMGMTYQFLPAFVSYAHADNSSSDPSLRWLDRLLEMLKPLKVADDVHAWSDKEIRAGDVWNSEIQEHLYKHARAAVLLVSPAFLASDFIRTSELPLLLYNYQLRANETRIRMTPMLIIPIILRHCLYDLTYFKFPHPVTGPESISLSVFQAANPPNRPLESMSRAEQDEVLASVARRLHAVIAEERRNTR
jgi:hypothetical protein